MDTKTNMTNMLKIVLFCPGPIIHESLSIWTWSEKISRHKRDAFELMEEVGAPVISVRSSVASAGIQADDNFTKVYMTK